MARFIKVILFLLVLIVGAGAFLIWYISPDEQLDMAYEDVDLKLKVSEVLQKRKLEVELDWAELNQLAKREFVHAVKDEDLPIELLGADFQFNEQQVKATINGKWKSIDFEGTATFIPSIEGKVIRLVHESTAVKDIPIPPVLVQLEPFVIDVDQYVPDPARVDKIQLLSEGIVVTLSIDWTQIR